MVTNPRAAPLLIGKLAERTGVSIETIRYYERIGLLPSPPRTAGRLRVYDEDHIQRLCFIRRGRQLSFPLDDIRTLLRLAGNGDAECLATREVTLRHLADIRGKISSLKKLERALDDLTDACKPDGQSSCPILEALGTDR